MRKLRANFIKTGISTSQMNKMQFWNKSKASSDMTDPWQMQYSSKSFLVPPKFSYVINCSPKPPTCSLIPLLWDIKHCNLVVMTRGGVSYLITAAKLMQNWGYVYSVLLDFLDNSNVCCDISPDFKGNLDTPYWLLQCYTGCQLTHAVPKDGHLIHQWCLLCDQHFHAGPPPSRRCRTSPPYQTASPIQSTSSRTSHRTKGSPSDPAPQPCLQGETAFLFTNSAALSLSYIVVSLGRSALHLTN
jgi:hypothetical protein